MKNPDPARGTGAFGVTSAVTFAPPVDATARPLPTSPFAPRLRWCARSNSVQTLTVRKGSIAHD